MKNLKNVRKGLQFLVVMIGFMIAISQIYSFSIENELMKNSNLNDLPVMPSEQNFVNSVQLSVENEKQLIQENISNQKISKNTNEPNCTRNGFYDAFLMLFKCSVAFLFGGMLSEMRFIKVGVI